MANDRSSHGGRLGVRAHRISLIETFEFVERIPGLEEEFANAELRRQRSFGTKTNIAFFKAQANK